MSAILARLSTTLLLAAALGAGACSSSTSGTKPDLALDPDTGAVKKDLGADQGIKQPPDLGAPDLVPPAAQACAGYCSQVQKHCSGANGVFSSEAACLKACLAEYLVNGAPGTTTGNSLQCRTTHAAQAAADPATHCPAASLSGGGICGDWCTVYCQYTQDHCQGVNRIYNDATACKTACAGFKTTGKSGDAAGSTVQCRLEHAGLRAHDAPATGCAAAQVTSSKTIGGPNDGACK